MDVPDFVQNVKRILDERGISYSRAGRESGAGIEFIRNMERKGSWPSTEKILKMSNYLGVSVSELLGEEIGPRLVVEDGLNKERQELVNLITTAPPALRAAALAVLKSADGQVVEAVNGPVRVLEARQVKRQIRVHKGVEPAQIKGVAAVQTKRRGNVHSKKVPGIARKHKKSPLE